MRQPMRVLCGLLLGLSLSACAGLEPQPTTARTSNVTFYTAARLILGDGTAIDNGAFIVRGSRFQDVGRAGELQAPAEATTVDLGGKTVMPALVNVHSHLGWEKYTSWGSQNMTRENLIDHLYRHAYYGVGTAAGTGSERESIAIAVERDQRLGLIGGARYIVVPGIGTPGGGPNPNFTADPGWFGNADGLHEVTSPEQARQVVRAEAAKGIRRLKMWVDTRDERRGAKVKLTPEIYTAVAEEAAAQDIILFTHAPLLEDHKRLIRAGARRLIHGSNIDDEWLTLMKDRNVYIMANGFGATNVKFYEDPFFTEHVSAAVIARLSDPAKVASAGSYPSSSFPSLWQEPRVPASPQASPQAAEEARLRTAANLKRMMAEGIKIVLAADAGFGPTGRVAGTFFGYHEHLQLENMINFGMTPSQAIVAATKYSAEALGLADVGTLAAGMSADFIVLDANPLDDIMNSRKISKVFLRGDELDRAALRAAWTK
jgi:imidazolonepropionase-like amidohydrolase